MPDMYMALEKNRLFVEKSTVLEFRLTSCPYVLVSAICLIIYECLKKVNYQAFYCGRDKKKNLKDFLTKHEDQDKVIKKRRPFWARQTDILMSVTEQWCLNKAYICLRHLKRDDISHLHKQTLEFNG